MTTLGLKNINMLSKEQYATVDEPATDELYAISGSGFGFPSSNYEDLELGASGSTYTAPANGYFWIDKRTAGTSQYVFMNNITRGFSDIQQPYNSDDAIRFKLQAQKGDIVQINYSASGKTTYFRFIYAEGE